MYAVKNTSYREITGIFILYERTDASQSRLASVLLSMLSASDLYAKMPVPIDVLLII